MKKSQSKSKYTAEEIMRDPDGYDEYESVQVKPTKKQQSILNTIRAVAVVNEQTQKDQIDEEVVKVLRQLKSQMGRAVNAEYGMNTSHTEGIKRCMIMIDNKITKLNKTTRK